MFSIYRKIYGNLFNRQICEIFSVYRKIKIFYKQTNYDKFLINRHILDNLTSLCKCSRNKQSLPKNFLEIFFKKEIYKNFL